MQKAVIHFFRQDETSPGDRVLIKLTASPKSIILFILFSKKAPRRASYFYLSRLKHGLPGPPGRMAHKEDPFHGRHQAPHCKQPWHVRPAERHRNAGHRLCPHGRALPPRHQRRHPFRVRAVRLPRSADGRLFLLPAATASASAPSTNASSSSSRPCSSLTFILHWPPRCSTLSFTTQLSARGMLPSQNRPRS